MTISQTLVFACIVTGCGDSAPKGPLPGAPTGTDIGLTAGDDPRECGYELTTTNPHLTPTEMYQNVVFTHDAAGLVATRFADDGDGNRLWTEVNAFDAMGHVVHRTVTLASNKTLQVWIAWDAFGRQIRLARDTTGDGMEDTVWTYSYGDGDLLLGIHAIDRTATYDESFAYDGLGRIVELDTVGAYPSMMAFSYDDTARVVTETYLSATDNSTAIGRFDDDDRPVSSEETHTDPVSASVTWIETITFAYPSPALTTQIDLVHPIRADGSNADDTSSRYDFHFGDCP